MPKKIGRKILLFLVVVTPVQWFTFSHYNHILSGGQSITAVSRTQETQTAEAKTQAFVEQLRQKHAQPVVVSDDGQYIAYVDNGSTVRVQDVSSNKEVGVVQMKAPVVYLSWISTDKLFVGEKFTVNGDPRLALATLNVPTQEVQLVKTYSAMYSTSTFKQIVFSPFTNDIYVLIGSPHSSQVYHFNTMQQMSVMNFGGRLIEKIGIGQTANVLYLQDFAEGTHNVLVYNKTVSLIQRNAELLKVVNNDLYYGDVDASGNVSQVSKYSGDTGLSSVVTSLSRPVPSDEVSVDDNGKVGTRAASASSSQQ